VRAPRFFVAGVHAPGDVVELGGGDARKLTLVLRRVAGDPLEIVDSAGRAFEARLAVAGGTVQAELVRAFASPGAPSLRVTLAQGIPKGPKMDYVVEKATELGVAGVLPFVSERTLGEGSREGKLERWRRLARTAAQQCGRPDLPEIAAPLAFVELVRGLGAFELALVPWELTESAPLRELLPPLLSGKRTVLVVIGPEGGLSHAEAQALGEAGAHLVSLGRRILRTETAGLVACSALFYESGDI
jgi:16S rRNA (uracil1498-N3)-methyltransferase